MKLSEKQALLLITCAQEYYKALTANGDYETADNVQILLNQIVSQQSDTLKELEAGIEN